MITNSYDPHAARPTLPVEAVFLYRPEAEWTYSHHPSLAWYRGEYWALWSNGRCDEDAPGQRVLAARAADFARWGEPFPLVDVRQGRHSEVVLTAAGFHQHAGRLLAYFGQYEYRPECLENGQRKPNDYGHMDTGLWALATGDGRAWSAPQALGLPIVPNHGPQPAGSGRLIISGNISFPYSDSPDGLTGWRMSGVYPPDLAAEIVDDSESFWRVRKHAGWAAAVCEGSFYRTDDGVLHMLLRSGTERLWLTESGDNGATWSAPTPTEFSDNVTKFHFGRLPDGRLYYVGCPDPEPRWQRDPLVLSLSEDGVRFDRHFILGHEPYERRRDGLHKGGNYGYPHTLIHGGYLHVIVSRRKEAVQVLRVPLAGL